MTRSYRALRDSEPSLDLPQVPSGAAARDAMAAWEREHPEALEESTTSATHLFGFVGQGKLAGRFDFVLVPAITDAALQAQDGRGTLLRQLLERAGGHSDAMLRRLKITEDELAATIAEIIDEDGTDALETVAAELTSELGRLVPTGTVNIEARPPEVRIPDIQVAMRVADGGLETDVGRQGHGFQRALSIALVRCLAGTDQLGDAPGLFLAFEEPELYQHPVQARHFARTLADLPRIPIRNDPSRVRGPFRTLR